MFHQDPHVCNKYLRQQQARCGGARDLGEADLAFAAASEGRDTADTVWLKACELRADGRTSGGVYAGVYGILTPYMFWPILHTASATCLGELLP